MQRRRDGGAYKEKHRRGIAEFFGFYKSVVSRRRHFVAVGTDIFAKAIALWLNEFSERSDGYGRRYRQQCRR